MSRTSAPIVIAIAACTVAGAWAIWQRSAASAPRPDLAPPSRLTAVDAAAPASARRDLASDRRQAELRARSAEIAAISDPAARKAALLAWLVQLAQAEPRLAAERALALSEEEGQRDVLREVLQEWSTRAPDAASAWLSARAERMPAETLLSLIGVTASFDIAPALQLAEVLPAGLRASAISAVFGGWTAQQPWAAAHAAEQLPEPSDRLAATVEVVRVWAHAEPAAALDWSRELYDPQLHRVAVDAALGTWVESEPAAAAAAVLTLPAEPARSRWLDRTLAAWGARDPEAAYAFVRRLDDPAERESAATALLSQLMPREPARAIEWARALSLGADNALLEKLITAWVAQDARAAVAWAQGLPARETQRSQLLGLALARWQTQDASAYRDWQSHTGQR